ncbi:hypothetical protein GH733_001152, partial [Mirounga leonina]
MSHTLSLCGRPENAMRMKLHQTTLTHWLPVAAVTTLLVFSRGDELSGAVRHPTAPEPFAVKAKVVGSNAPSEVLTRGEDLSSLVPLKAGPIPEALRELSLHAPESLRHCRPDEAVSRPDKLLAHDGTYDSQQHPDILPYNLNYQRYCFVDLSGLNAKNRKDVPFGSTRAVALDLLASDRGPATVQLCNKPPEKSFPKANPRENLSITSSTQELLVTLFQETE